MTIADWKHNIEKWDGGGGWGGKRSQSLKGKVEVRKEKTELQ